MPDLKTYTGGCHCGKVRYTVSADLARVVSCNCSICSKRGFLWTFVPPEQFALQGDESDLVEYRFNRKAVRHLFCPACGVESFARGTPPGGTAEVIAINVRCLDDIDLGGLTLMPFDGRRL